MKFPTLSAIALTCVSMAIPLSLSAQTRSPNQGDGRAPALHFVDVFDGDLVSNGRHTRAGLNMAGKAIPLRGVEFWFTPDAGGRPMMIGTDTVGLVPGFGPICGERGCMERGVYEMMIGENLRA